MNKKKSASAGIMSFCGEYSYILVFIAIFIVYAFTSSGLTWSGVMNVFRHSAVIGIIGIGMGLVCLTGEIDLSVGAMLALDGGFSVIIFNMTDSILLTFLFAIVFGAFCGLVNGVMVGLVEMPAFIVTLATMLMYRSFAQYFCQHMDKVLIGNGSSVYKMASDKKSLIRCSTTWETGKMQPASVCGNRSDRADYPVCICYYKYQIWQESLCSRKQPQRCENGRHQCCSHEGLCICDLWCTGRCSSISLDCHERILRPGNNRNQL